MASIITIAGEKLFAAKAQANEQLDIDTFIFANVPEQDATAPINREEALPTDHVVHQQIVQQVGRINDNVVVYSTVLDSIIGPFEFNWVGLYSSINNALVAINHIPTTPKTKTESGVAGNTLNRNFGIEYSGIAELTGISVSPETWQLDFSARLSGMDKLTQQLAEDLNGKDWFIDDGFNVTPRSTANTFRVAPGVGYVSGLRVEIKEEHILTLQSYPQFVYVDTYFDGNALSQWSPQVVFTVSDTEMDDYVDVNGIQHFVLKISVISDVNKVDDLRASSKVEKIIDDLKKSQNDIIWSIETLDLVKARNDLKVGQRIKISDRNNSEFEVKLSEGLINNDFDTIQCTLTPELSLVLIDDDGDIRNYGGRDDYSYTEGTGTNNKPIIDYLYDKKPIEIKLPKSEEGTGVYLYDGFSSKSDASGVSIIADEGVSLANYQGNSPLWINGLKVNREIASYRLDGKYFTHMGPNVYTKPSEQQSIGGASIGSLYTPYKINLTETRNYTLSNWPDGELVAASPISSTDVDINWGAIPNFNFYLSAIPVSVKDHISAHVSKGAERPCAFVETDHGWVIIHSKNNSGKIQVSEKFREVTIQKDFTELVLNESTYNMNNAAIGIIIFGTKSFGLTLNGILIRRIDTEGSIIAAGWGAGFEANAASLSISRASYFKGKKTVGIKPLKIVCVGDSTSSGQLASSQYEYMKKHLTGTCGAQVLEMKNLAIGGQVSAQQLAILESTNIDNFDYCCIQIGINDVQTNSGSLALASNIEAMIDYCESLNVVPIIGLPTSFYSQLSAKQFGQDGQNTGRSDEVGVFRNVLLQTLADRGGVFVNPSVVEDQGAVVAALLDTELDPILSDNIHPSAFGKMLMGYSFAKSIIGHATGSDSKGGLVKSPSDWWTGEAGKTAAPLYKASAENIHWSWFLSTDNETFSNGDLIGKLPRRFWPENDFYAQAINTTSASDIPTEQPNAILHFSKEGHIKVFNVDPAAVYISFNTFYELSN
ncbi:phage tail protein [Pseudoalteromonas sp. TAB23]|uniref:phage tail-collar fiber domain-containing protein n=1 Tax=Pseudoalteromonas sp. TAB23 TaxID=1938595 RepID=UPI0004016455|nr:phage tail protein [Pseudoalteromonas sp. TAB23]